MFYQELLQRAIDIANLGLPEDTAFTTAEQAIEPVVRSIFRSVGVAAARTARLRTTLRKTKPLAVVNGVVALSSDVLTPYIDESSLIDAANKTKLYGLCEWHAMTNDELDSRLGHYALEGEATLHVVEPGTVYSPTAGPTVALLLTTPCAPAVPVLIGDPVVATEEVLDLLLAALAEGLKTALTK